MPLEGRLDIDLYPNSEPTHRVAIRSTRPLTAARVFHGKTPPQVLEALPLLFSVCRTAQSAAAVQAFEDALSTPADAALNNARKLLVDMETAREHVWRILIDWPDFMGEASDPRPAGSLQSLLSETRSALFAAGSAFALHADLSVDQSALLRRIDRLDETLATTVFRRPAADWLRITDQGELDAWLATADSVAARLLQHVVDQGWQNLGAVNSAFLPALPKNDLHQHLAAADADHFIGAPTWRRRPRETTPLARQRDTALIRSLLDVYGNGLLTRLAARLVELARLPADLRALAARLVCDDPARVPRRRPAYVGIGEVEAARGHLVHRVVLDDGHVRRYQILAPTEWNFHPQGVVTRALESLGSAASATLRRQAELLVNAVDPCVEAAIEVH